jgi:glycine oxidase
MSQTTAGAPDLVIVGGGVIGLSIAWRAMRRGLRVVVLERDRVGRGTSWHAAGMIAPVAEVAPGEAPVLALGLRSAALYPSFVAELIADADADADAGVGYTRCGTLLVARDGDDARALERELSLRASLGLSHSVTRLLPTAARRLEPGLAPTLRLALHLHEDHAVDPRALCAALARAVLRGGGEIREGASVRAVDDAGAVLDDGTRVTARQTVIAAGTWSGAVSDEVTLRPVKGQIMRLHDPAGPGLLTRVIRMGRVYIVPRGDGRYVLGATSEERGFDTTVTAGAALQLLREAGELVPGISELVLDEFTAGLRPGTADNLPVIGPAPSGQDGVWWATGHFRGGVLLAPATAELVVAMVCGEPVEPLADAFAPGRLWAGRAGQAGQAA